MRGSRKFCQRRPNFDNAFLGYEGSIKIPLLVGHHRHEHITPFKLRFASLACRWWPNIELWLGSFVIFQFSGDPDQHCLALCFSLGVGGGAVEFSEKQMSLYLAWGTSWHARTENIQISLRIRTVWSELKKSWTLGYPQSVYRRLWSNCEDAQADLSLWWVHMSACTFCVTPAQMVWATKKGIVWWT